MIHAAALRWSYGARAWFGHFSVLDDGRIYVAHELTWLRVAPENAAQTILAAKKEWRVEFDYIVANAEMFPSVNEYGETVSETFRKSGVAIRRGSDDRNALWSRFRSWLSVTQPDGQPSFIIDPSCKYLRRTLPTLLTSKTDPDDVDAVPEEYPAMGCALFVMSRPMPGDEDKPPYPDGALGYEVDDLRRACADLE